MTQNQYELMKMLQINNNDVNIAKRIKIEPNDDDLNTKLMITQSYSETMSISPTSSLSGSYKNQPSVSLFKL